MNRGWATTSSTADVRGGYGLKGRQEARGADAALPDPLYRYGPTEAMPAITVPSVRISATCFMDVRLGQRSRLGSYSYLYEHSSAGTAIVRSRSPTGSGPEGQVGVILHLLPGLLGAGNGGGGRRRSAPRVTGSVVRR